MAIIPSLIAAGTALGSAGLSSLAQSRINRQNIEEARRIMQTQRDWALSDWEKVNSYNSPEQQMQRYKEAGLNPQLIYGSAQNSPSAMVRSSASPMPNIGGSGYQAASSALASGASQAMNNYFAFQKLDLEKALTAAQVLNLKANADKTNQQVRLTEQQWEDLVMSPFFSNLTKQAGIEYLDTKRNLLPTREMAWERYAKETAKTDANSQLALELFEKAKNSNKLTKLDIQTLENLGGSNTGIKLVVDLLRLILK